MITSLSPSDWHLLRISLNLGLLSSRKQVLRGLIAVYPFSYLAQGDESPFYRVAPSRRFPWKEIRFRFNARSVSISLIALVQLLFASACISDGWPNAKSESRFAIVVSRLTKTISSEVIRFRGGRPLAVIVVGFEPRDTATQISLYQIFIDRSLLCPTEIVNCDSVSRLTERRPVCNYRDVFATLAHARTYALRGKNLSKRFMADYVTVNIATVVSSGRKACTTAAAPNYDPRLWQRL